MYNRFYYGSFMMSFLSGETIIHHYFMFFQNSPGYFYFSIWTLNSDFLVLEFLCTFSLIQWLIYKLTWGILTSMILNLVLKSYLSFLFLHTVLWGFHLVILYIPIKLVLSGPATSGRFVWLAGLASRLAGIFLKIQGWICELF